MVLLAIREGENMRRAVPEAAAMVFCSVFIMLGRDREYCPKNQSNTLFLKFQKRVECFTCSLHNRDGNEMLPNLINTGEVMKMWLSMVVAMVSVAMAQDELEWIDPLQHENWHLEGRVHEEKQYGRLPKAAEKKVRKAVWNLSLQNAGLYVKFMTDAPEIQVKYTYRGPLAMFHMPATGVSGFDLYRQTAEGGLRWVDCSKPKKASGVIKLAAGDPVAKGKPSLFKIYLPLYNGVKQFELAVAKGYSLTPAKAEAKKPIVVYGTSIAQGACATRPGLAWTSILSRKLDWPVVNLGFSGNGRMEPEVVDYVISKDAAVYVIDCLPNLNAAQVKKLARPLVKQIRAKHATTPILLVESPPYDNTFFFAAKKEGWVAECKELKAAYDELSKSDPNLYYLSGDSLLGDDGEATVDGVHPNDIGMERYAKAYAEALKKPLKMAANTINLPTTEQEIEGVEHAMVLEVSGRGMVKVAEKEYSKENLRRMMQRVFRISPTKPITIWANGETTAEQALDVFNLCKKEGLTNVTIAAKSERK